MDGMGLMHYCCCIIAIIIYAILHLRSYTTRIVHEFAEHGHSFPDAPSYGRAIAEFFETLTEAAAISYLRTAHHHDEHPAYWYFVQEIGFSYHWPFVNVEGLRAEHSHSVIKLLFNELMLHLCIKARASEKILAKIRRPGPIVTTRIIPISVGNPQSASFWNASIFYYVALEKVQAS